MEVPMSAIWEEAMLEAFRETTKRLGVFLPKVFALLTFLALGLAAGWLIKFLVLRILRAFRFDALCERLRFTPALVRAGIKQPASQLVGRLAFWVIFLLFAFMGVDALDLEATTNLLAVLIAFLPHVVAAGVLLLFGLLLANFFAEAALIAAVNAQIQEARLIASGVRWGILIFTTAMVLTQLGIAKEIVVAAFSIIFGGIVFALSIAIGLGARNIVRQALERRLARKAKAPEDHEMSHI
jgi:hypothetical protein